MDNEERSVCVAVLQYTDRRCSGGYRLKSFHVEQEFIDFLERYHGMIHSDEAMVILLGGDHKITTLDAVGRMNWILETA